MRVCGSCWWCLCHRSAPTLTHHLHALVLCQLFAVLTLRHCRLQLSVGWKPPCILSKVRSGPQSRTHAHTRTHRCYVRELVASCNGVLTLEAAEHQCPSGSQFELPVLGSPRCCCWVQATAPCIYTSRLLCRSLGFRLRCCAAHCFCFSRCCGSCVRCAPNRMCTSAVFVNYSPARTCMLN